MIQRVQSEQDRHIPLSDEFCQELSASTGIEVEVKEGYMHGLMINLDQH